MFMFCKLVLDHFITPKEEVSNGTAYYVSTALIKLLPFNFDSKIDLVLK
jgi:hypothetical protein